MTKRITITVGGLEVFSRTYADDEDPTIEVEEEQVSDE